MKADTAFFLHLYLLIFFSILMCYMSSSLSFIFFMPVFENPLENACAV